MKYLNNITKYLDKIQGEISSVPLYLIEKFERDNNIIFPLAYTEFLLNMGLKAGDIFSGSDYNFTHLQELQKEGKQIYLRRMSVELPKEYFIILVHQGYSFYAFNLLEGNNPPVYLFVDGDEPTKLNIEYETFSLCIEKNIISHLELRKYLSNPK